MRLLHMYAWAALFVAGVSLAPGKTPTTTPIDDSEILTLADVEVSETIRTLKPNYQVEIPRFTHFEKPDLPNGDLILALSFIDRYELSETPDAVKWAGIVTFPAEDGLGRRFVKRICLFYYDEKLFGWDPGAPEKYQRFETNLTAADLNRPEALLNFANHYLEEVMPRHSVWVNVANINDDMVGLLPEFDVMFNYSGQYSPRNVNAAGEPLLQRPLNQRVFLEVDGAKVSPIPGATSKDPRELVNVTYFYLEHPNHRKGDAPIYGAEPMVESSFQWSDLLGKVRPGEDDCYRTAKQLLAGRWCQPARLVSSSNVLFVKDVPSYDKVLLFAMNQKVFAYHPELGVWDGNLTLADLQSGNVAGKFAFPGKDAVSDIKLLDW